jgi:colanic acid/amylovoran biosynthesis glycosyltransferase
VRAEGAIVPAKKVLLFRNELLPASETFIRAQAEALRRFEPRFAGVHAALNSMPLEPRPALVDSRSNLLGKMRRRLFWRTSIAPQFYRAVRQMAPALIHAHFALDGAAALPVARALGVPLAVTLHGYDVTSSDDALAKSEEGRLYLRRRRELWKYAATFLCVSKFIRERAIERGFPEEKLRVHRTGIDLGLFDGVRAERDRNLIVFTGRLVEKKGCRYLLEALWLARVEHPEVRLVVIGAGPLEGELKAQALAAGLRCEFLGSQTPESVREQLSLARVFCVPSVRASTGDSEGLGMVFAEAQAMGTPVVSFAHGGIPEVVLHGETGLLAAEGDSRELATHLHTLLSDHEVWRRYSERGMSWIREAFDVHRQTGYLEDIYESVVSGS